MTKHIETPSLPLAQAVVDEVDAEFGFPSIGVNVGSPPHADLSAAAAWVANPVGDPPPGVTRTWDVPLQRPTPPPRYGVVVTDELMQSVLIGKQPPGWAQAIQAQDAVERGPEWFQ